MTNSKLEKIWRSQLFTPYLFGMLLIVALIAYSCSFQVLYLDGGRLISTTILTDSITVDWPHLRYSSVIFQLPLLFASRFFNLVDFIPETASAIISTWILFSYVLSIKLIQTSKQNHLFEFAYFYYGLLVLLSVGFSFSFALDPLIFVFPFSVYLTAPVSDRKKNIWSFFITIFLMFSYETSLLYFLSFLMIDYIRNKKIPRLRACMFISGIVFLSYIILFRVDGPNKYPFFDKIFESWDIYTYACMAMFLLNIVFMRLNKNVGKLFLLIILGISLYYIYYFVRSHYYMNSGFAFMGRRFISAKYLIFFTIFPHLGWIKSNFQKKKFFCFGKYAMILGSFAVMFTSSQWMGFGQEMRSLLKSKEGCFMLDLFDLKYTYIGEVVGWEQLPWFSLLAQGQKIKSIPLVYPPKDRTDLSRDDRCPSKYPAYLNISGNHGEVWINLKSNGLLDTSLFNEEN